MALMLLALEFSPSWYILLVGFAFGWLMISYLRRKLGDRVEARQQIILGALGMVALTSMEVFAVSTNLWNYTPDNWPVILWPTYFVAILFGYQLLRVVEELV